MRYRSDKYRPNQRPVESKKEDPIFKYFIIFEGEKTESSYLEALRGVSKKHPFVMVEKVGNEKGLTLLNQMIALADDMLKKDNANKCTYQRAYSNIAKEFQSKGLKPLTEQGLMKKISSIHRNTLKDVSFGDEIQKDKLKQVLEELVNYLDSSLLSLGNEVDDLLNFSYPEFSKGFDKIAIIVDRDRQGTPDDEKFKKDVLSGIEKGYRILVTNPCFEFWLLLHIKKDFSKQDITNLKKGKLPNHNENVAYELLKQYDSRYSKDFKNAADYVRKTKQACENVKSFSENPIELVDHLGSSLGQFLKENLDL